MNATTEFLRRLGRNRLWDVAALVLALLSVARIGLLLPEAARRGDFSEFYSASRLLIEGRDLYGPDFGEMFARYGFIGDGHAVAASYPPAWNWFFVPFALLPPGAAFVAWLLVQVVSLGVILWLVRDLLRDRLTRRGWFFVCAGTVMSATVYWHFYYSQVQLLLAALVLAGYRWYRQERPAAACLAVTAAGLLKLFPFALLPWLVWRGGGNARGRARLALVSLALAVPVVLFTGVTRWFDFFGAGLPRLAGVAVNHSFNFTLPSFIINLGWAGYGFEPPAAVAQTWWTLGVMSWLGVFALAYGVVARSAGRDVDGEFCLLCVAILVGSVKAIGHYFVFLIFPVAVVAARPGIGRVVGLGALVVTLNLLGTVTSPFLDRHLYLKVLANYLPLAGLLGLGWFFGRDLVRKGK